MIIGVMYIHIKILIMKNKKEPKGEWIEYNDTKEWSWNTNERKPKKKWNKKEIIKILTEFSNDHVDCQNANIKKWFKNNMKNSNKK